MDAALFERLLHVAEFREQATRHDLRFAFLAGAVAHFVEPVIDEIQLEIVVIDARGIQAEHAHLAELERHAAGRRQVAAGLGEDRAHLRHGARRVVGRGFDDDRDAVRRITFVDDLFVRGRVLAEGALDRGFDLVLRHVDVARVLHRAAQRRVGADVGAAGLDGHVDVLGNARELLGHAVPAREHRVLAYFENASHRARILARISLRERRTSSLRIRKWASISAKFGSWPARGTMHEFLARRSQGLEPVARDLRRVSRSSSPWTRNIGNRDTSVPVPADRLASPCRHPSARRT